MKRTGIISEKRFDLLSQKNSPQIKTNFFYGRVGYDVTSYFRLVANCKKILPFLRFKRHKNSFSLNEDHRTTFRLLQCLDGTSVESHACSVCRGFQTEHAAFGLAPPTCGLLVELRECKKVRLPKVPVNTNADVFVLC